MKFSTNRDHFANALSLVLSVVSGKGTLPVLSNVLIEAAAGALILTATNLDQSIRAKVKADVKASGRITLPVRRLASIVRELPAVDVSVSVSDRQQATINSGGSEFKIMGIGAEEFPAIPVIDEKTVRTFSQANLAGLLQSVAFAQSTDDTRYTLHCVFCDFRKDGARFVATDGRRLAMADAPAGVDGSGTGSILLPFKTVSEIIRLLGSGKSVRLGFDDRRVAFTIDTDEAAGGLLDNVYFFSRVVEGSYPNYMQVVPKDMPIRLSIEREPFFETVRRAALVCSEKSNSVRLALRPNVLEVTAKSSDFGEAQEELMVEHGATMQIGFNPVFLADPLKNSKKDKLSLDLKDETSPAVIRDDNGWLCVIMPMRAS